jgi:hypothetical protein
MAVVTVDTDGGIPVSGGQYTGVIAVQRLPVLVRMTGLTLLVSFHLEIAMVVGGDLRVRIRPDIGVAVRALQSGVDRGSKNPDIYGER